MRLLGLLVFLVTIQWYLTLSGLCRAYLYVWATIVGWEGGWTVPIYKTRGLLDEIPHRKLIRGVLIIRPEDEGRLVQFLDQYDAEYHTRTIILTREDQKALTPQTKQ